MLKYNYFHSLIRILATMCVYVRMLKVLISQPFGCIWSEGKWVPGEMVHFHVNLGNITVILGEINAALKQLRSKTQPRLKGRVLYLGRNTPICLRTKSSPVIQTAAQQDREDKPPSSQSLQKAIQ